MTNDNIQRSNDCRASDHGFSVSQKVFRVKTFDNVLALFC